MKFTLGFLAVSCLLGLIQGDPLTVAYRESCPFDMDCEAYAKEQLKNTEVCRTYSFVDSWIEWRVCDVRLCPGNQTGQPDLSKPFPDCCPQCEE